MKEMQSLGLDVRPGSKDEQPSLQLGDDGPPPVDGMTEGFDSDDMAGLADVDFSDLKFEYPPYSTPVPQDADVGINILQNF